MQCFFLQNQPSTEVRAPKHERLVATRAKPSRGLQSQIWICSFSRHCARRMTATQKRCVTSFCLFTPVGVVIQTQNPEKTFSYPPCVSVLIDPLCYWFFQVKNVYQTSFSAFLESMDLSRSLDFPQVSRHITSPACLVSIDVTAIISQPPLSIHLSLDEPYACCH